MHFNPADIQTIGIGISAFLATLIALFIFSSAARSDKSARSIGYTMFGVMVWAWFGFFSATTENFALSRDFRVVSVIGIIWIVYNSARFALNYLSELRPARRLENIVMETLFGIGIVLTLVLVYDLGGGHTIVGVFLQSPSVALAPQPGPYLWLIIAYHAICILLMILFFSQRAIVAAPGVARQQSLILGVSFTLAIFLGFMRYTGWYGFDIYPLLTGLGMPLFAVAVFYVMRKYSLFSVRVLVTQLLVFALWSFTFFRVLIEPSLAAAVPDIGLFVAVLIVGTLLIRSSISDARTQQELAGLEVERTKSEFITIAAHQLRTPVSALRWSFNLLAEAGGQLSDKQRAIIEKGNHAADNMARLVNDLLTMGHIADGKFRYVFAEGNVGDTVRAEAGLFEEIAQHKSVTLEIHIADDLPPISYDAERLNLAIQNLVDNAIKYTKAGGRVIVGAEKAGKGVHITVKDTGIGFSTDEKKRIFDKFFRGSRAVLVSPDGSGLGLFIAKTVVEGHGGTLSLTSAENEGTTFTISLPDRPPVKA